MKTVFFLKKAETELGMAKQVNYDSYPFNANISILYTPSILRILLVWLYCTVMNAFLAMINLKSSHPGQ
jgi:hypothetical protein